MTTKERDNDDIDLIHLAARAAYAIKKNIKLLLALSFVGLAIGILATYVVDKKYESKMLLSSDILTFSYAEKLTKTLQGLVSEGNTKLLESRLNMTEEEASKIVDINIEEGLEQTDALKEDEKHYLVLTVRTLDPQILPRLEKGIIRYFETNPFVVVRVKQRKAYFQQLIEQVDDQIRSLKELQMKINTGSFLENSKGTVMFDLTTVNTKIVELTKEKINYQNSLELVNSIDLIEGFTPFAKPVTGKTFTSAFIGLFIGAFIALIIIALKALNNSIKKFEPAA